MAFSILFVDDDKALLEGIGRLLTLERRYISFSLAFTGEEALELLKGRHFDVIVSDHLMQGMTGLTLLSIARREYPDMKRVMLSAQIQDEIYSEAEKFADLYISKPCDTITIITRIEKLLNNEVQEDEQNTIC